jgi:hypothetical protein
MRFLAILFLAFTALAADNVEQYRAQREATLKQDDGWLTVVGLFRLKEGDNRVGAGEPNEIVLPASAPAILARSRSRTVRQSTTPKASLA